MTVSVEVDGQLHSGSSVIEVRVSKQPMFLPGVNPFEYKVEGEAICVDLGGQRNLIALLASGNYAEESDYPIYLVPRRFNVDLLNERQLASLADLRGRREFASNDLPTLVTFSSASDSATLSVVRPDQLDKTFGPGVYWRGVVVEMTTAPVSHGIEARLPFLMTQKSTLSNVYDHPNKFTPHYEAFLRR